MKPKRVLPIFQLCVPVIFRFSQREISKKIGANMLLFEGIFVQNRSKCIKLTQFWTTWSDHFLDLGKQQTVVYSKNRNYLFDI